MTNAAGGARGVEVQGWGDEPHWGVQAALLLASAALLVLEVSLTRFFSFTIWYHFAYLTISVALLGFGSSGALVTGFPALFARRGQQVLLGSLVVAALAAGGGLAFLAQYPIEVRNLMSAPLHFSASLLVYYAVVGTPFLLAGFAVSLPFAAWPHRMGRLYFWDLLGAACGCAFVVLMIEVLGVPGLVFAASGLLLAAAACLGLAAGRGIPAVVLGATAFVVLAVAGPAGHRLPVSITASKNLTELRMPAPGVPSLDQRSDVFSRWTAINRVDCFGWDYPLPYSFWSAIGINNDWKGYKPPVARLTYDGCNGSDVYGFHGDIQREFAMLEHHMLRLPYLMLDKPNVLAIGVGGGVDLFNAIKQGARHVTGAELQPVTVDLLKNRLRSFNSGFYHRDDVTLVASEGRHFVRKSTDTYDLVQVTAVDTFAAQSTGAYVLAESYLYTVEAMQDYLRHLSPDGLVTMVVGDLLVQGELPPLATRLGLIGLRALEAEGVADPGAHLLVVNSVARGELGQNEVVMVKKSPFTAEEIRRVKGFVGENGFTMLFAPHDPTMPMAAVLGPDEALRQQTLDAAWFRMEATTDGDPFFYNVGKWSRVSPQKSTVFMMPGSFMGQLVLVLMVLQSAVLGTALVLFPLARGAREGLAAPRLASVLAYFLALGVGFMFLEISFVQSFVLFLGSPTYALSVTLFALLLFSGVGSLVSSRYADRPEAALRHALPTLVVLVIGYAFGLSRLFDAALHLELPVRIALAVAVQMPLGLTLGMFMPLGIAVVAREHPRLVPWAWGVNGVGSVVGTTLAVLLAMAAGFRAVSLTAAVLYVAGTMLLLRASRGRTAA